MAAGRLQDRLDRWLYRLAGRRPLRIIRPDAGQPYLERYFLCRLPRWLGGWSAYLHRFVASDPPGYGLHDHPWSLALSFVLVGGYLEARLDRLDGDCRASVRSVAPGSLNIIRGTTFHRVILGNKARPAWSLFLHAPHRKGWGFLKHEGEMLVAANGSAAGAIALSYTPAVAVTDASRGAPWWRTAPRGRDEPRRLPLKGLTPVVIGIDPASGPDLGVDAG